MKLSCLLAAASAGLFAVSSACGSVVYTYTGNTYVDFLPPIYSIYDSTMRVSGSMVLPAPLAPDLAAAAVTPASFTFGDGLTVFTQGSIESGIFEFWTDASGNIVNWYVDLRTEFPSPTAVGDTAGRLVTENDAVFVRDGGSIGSCTAVIAGTCTQPVTIAASLSYIPGSWTVSGIPLPGAAYLFVSGLLGLIGTAGRKATSSMNAE